MQELADAVHLSQSALSRVIGRLEKRRPRHRGDVRERPPRRSSRSLTDEGRERYEAARPTHRAVLERELS